MDFTKKYMVFISSTYTDLINARSKVIESILSMNQIPLGMEMFSAGNNDQWSLIKNNLRLCDYYLLVVGQRYGSLSSDGISYTEKEYEFAQEIGLPILAFIQDRNTPTTPSERESDPYLQSKLNEFIARVMKGKICDFWINEDDLARRVSISLMKEFVNNPGIGWVRADSVNYGKKPKDTRIQPNIDSFLYEKKLSGLKDLTIKNYELQLNIFSSYFKDKMLSEINTKEIVNFLAYREKAYNMSVLHNSVSEKKR